MLEARKVTLRLGRKLILDQVDFQAQAGQITALLGRNGSGKTSLLRCLAGTQERCGGQILLDGAPVREMRAAARARHISLLPQVLPRPPIAVEQMVSFGRQPYLGPGGRLSERDRALVRVAMERAGILSHRADLVCHLSGGERQLACLALLLAQDTPAVLLDEPTASLDAEYRRRVYDLLRQMRTAGKTVVVVLHDLSDAVELADSLCVLDSGKNCFAGDPRSFLSGDVPERIFGLTPKAVTDGEGGRYTIFRPAEK